jgi:hypothetical protein
MRQVQVGQKSDTMNRSTENSTFWNLTAKQTHDNDPFLDILLESNGRILRSLLKTLLEELSCFGILQL